MFFSRVFSHLRGNLLLEVLPDDLVRLPAKEEQAGGEDDETGPPLHIGHGGCWYHICLDLLCAHSVSVDTIDRH